MKEKGFGWILITCKIFLCNLYVFDLICSQLNKGRKSYSCVHMEETILFPKIDLSKIKHCTPSKSIDQIRRRAELIRSDQASRRRKQLENEIALGYGIIWILALCKKRTCTATYVLKHS